MADTPLKDFALPVSGGLPDSHIMRAVQTILAQLKQVADDNGQLIFKDRAEMVKLSRDSIYRPNSPYALLSVMPLDNAETTGDGTTYSQTLNLQLALVFSAWEGVSGETEVQAWADALRERVMLYLDPYNDGDLPTGIDFRKEIVPHAPGVGEQVWRWHGARKGTLDRNVVQAQGGTTKLPGLRWRYNLTLGIMTFPCTPLN